jgi:hypothetical protein
MARSRSLNTLHNPTLKRGLQMKKIIFLPILVVAVIVGIAIAGNHGAFNTHLTGAGEVPPVDTKAQGQATFHVSRDGMSVSYRVMVANLENVRASHIHLAAPGVNGPVIVTLFGGPTIEGPFNGVLAEGSFTAADFTGPMGGQTIERLLEELAAGNLYVNVHTDAYPSGEIRGQL